MLVAVVSSSVKEMQLLPALTCSVKLATPYLFHMLFFSPSCAVKVRTGETGVSLTLGTELFGRRT